jgi:hypothetical protein
MNKLQAAVLASVVVLGCGKGDKGDSKDAPETETIALGTTGYVVDVPKGWTVEVPMAGFFEFKGGRPKPQIMMTEGAPESLDDLVKGTCDGRPDIQKGTLANGVWVACKGESKMIKGVQTTQIAVQVKGEPKTFDCHLETDKDVDVPLNICKSIRKK